MRNQLYEKAELLQSILIAEATGIIVTNCDSVNYVGLRNEFVKNSILKKLLPDFVIKCRSLSQFWSYIKDKYGTYKERREYIWSSCENLLNYLESSEENKPSDQLFNTAMATFNTEHVKIEWQKAIERRISDPEGAITSARTLLETVCKHILDYYNITYDNKIDLPQLYKLTASQLDLSPEKHAEQIFKQILGGCITVVNGLSSLRNQYSDAHGKSKRSIKPATRHAQLAVNLAGALTTFLIDTFNYRNSKNK